MKVEPIVLTGALVRLEPFDESHIAALWQIGADPQLWKFMPFRVETEEQFSALFRSGMSMAQAGTGVGFAQRALPSEDLVGATGYWNIDPEHRRLEIGSTWLTSKWQRSGINTEAKLLLLRHAFKTLGCIRVEFKTDSRNRRSRDALLRIGAVEEGTMRNHMVMPPGDYRHSVYYSIIESEWPSVEMRLGQMLDEHTSATA